MHRKEIGNGAPNDGFGLTEVYGWALGAITTPAPQTYYVDNAMVYGVAPVRPAHGRLQHHQLQVTEGATATITAKLSKPSAHPVTVHIGTMSRLSDRQSRLHPGLRDADLPTQHHPTILHHLNHRRPEVSGRARRVGHPCNPHRRSGAGVPAIARLAIQDNEAYYPPLLEDFETYPYLWKAAGKAELVQPGDRRRNTAGAARPGCL